MEPHLPLYKSMGRVLNLLLVTDNTPASFKKDVLTIYRYNIVIYINRVVIRGLINFLTWIICTFLTGYAPSANQLHNMNGSNSITAEHCESKRWYETITR